MLYILKLFIIKAIIGVNIILGHTSLVRMSLFTLDSFTHCFVSRSSKDRSPQQAEFHCTSSHNVRHGCCGEGSFLLGKRKVMVVTTCQPLPSTSAKLWRWVVGSAILWQQQKRSLVRNWTMLNALCCSNVICVMPRARWLSQRCVGRANHFIRGLQKISELNYTLSRTLGIVQILTAVS